MVSIRAVVSVASVVAITALFTTGQAWATEGTRAHEIAEVKAKIGRLEGELVTTIREFETAGQALKAEAEIALPTKWEALNGYEYCLEVFKERHPSRECRVFHETYVEWARRYKNDLLLIRRNEQHATTAETRIEGEIGSAQRRLAKLEALVA